MQWRVVHGSPISLSPSPSMFFALGWGTDCINLWMVRISGFHPTGWKSSTYLVILTQFPLLQYGWLIPNPIYTFYISLKLTARTWKWMLGNTFSFPFGSIIGPIFRWKNVRFRERNWSSSSSQAHGGGQIWRLPSWSPSFCLGCHGHQTTFGGTRSEQWSKAWLVGL